jgi:hypothetical protein
MGQDRISHELNKVAAGRECPANGSADAVEIIAETIEHANAVLRRLVAPFGEILGEMEKAPM